MTVPWPLFPNVDSNYLVSNAFITNELTVTLFEVEKQILFTNANDPLSHFIMITSRLILQHINRLNVTVNHNNEMLHIENGEAKDRKHSCKSMVHF